MRAKDLAVGAHYAPDRALDSSTAHTRVPLCRVPTATQHRVALVTARGANALGRAGGSLEYTAGCT